MNAIENGTDLEEWTLPELDFLVRLFAALAERLELTSLSAKIIPVLKEMQEDRLR